MATIVSFSILGLIVLVLTCLTLREDLSKGRDK